MGGGGGRKVLSTHMLPKWTYVVAGYASPQLQTNTFVSNRGRPDFSVAYSIVYVITN